MLLALYNIFLITTGVLLFPVLLLLTLSRAKYRGRTSERLGLALGKKTNILNILNEAGEAADSSVIWIHALSVGEVTSALPLVKALRADMPEVVLVLTVATASGRKTAETLLRPFVQVILFSPFDLRCAVRRYIEAFHPDCFIQVETDFWPNWLDLLRKKGIPTILVNGRISAKSFLTYRRFRFFFRPMFCSFDLLSMQTAEDCRKMTRLGVPADRVLALGNLKYDMEQPDGTEKGRVLPESVGKGRFVWVCGSTHPGEEDILFAAYALLSARFSSRLSAGQGVAEDIAEQLFLVLAPRDINRGQELVALAGGLGLEAGLRSRGEEGGQVLILDTLGELAQCYGQADLAFIGGSLVPQGGHNPIEPAVHGVPVLFGPHTEDFSEITDELVRCGGGKRVTAESLTETLVALLADKNKRAVMGRAAQDLVEHHRGGVRRHVQVIEKFLVVALTTHHFSCA